MYIIFNQNKKNTFKKPTVVQIFPQGSSDCYLIDLTEIPPKLQTDENVKYLFNIIDIFSKFSGSYIISNKWADTIVGYIKEFINKYGKPKKLHSGNGN